MDSSEEVVIPQKILKIVGRMSPLERNEFWAKVDKIIESTPKFSIRKPPNGSANQETLFFMT